MRFSDKLDLEDYLEVMGGISIAATNSSGSSRFVLRLQKIAGYWYWARSLIPREIGGNEYIDSKDNAKAVLPELRSVLPERRQQGKTILGPYSAIFRDTMKAVCLDGQDAPDPHLVFTKFHRSCTDNVGFDISGGANGLRLRRR